MGLVANGNNSRIGIGDPAGVVLLLADAVDDIRFDIVRMGSRPIDGANNVDLIVLPRLVTAIDVNNVIGIVDPKDWVCSVPVNVVALPQSSGHLKEETVNQNEKKEVETAHYSSPLWHLYDCFGFRLVCLRCRLTCR